MLNSEVLYFLLWKTLKSCGVFFNVWFLVAVHLKKKFSLPWGDRSYMVFFLSNNLAMYYVIQEEAHQPSQSCVISSKLASYYLMDDEYAVNSIILSGWPCMWHLKPPFFFFFFQSLTTILNQDLSLNCMLNFKKIVLTYHNTRLL